MGGLNGKVLPYIYPNIYHPGHTYVVKYGLYSPWTLTQSLRVPLGKKHFKVITHAL